MSTPENLWFNHPTDGWTHLPKLAAYEAAHADSRPSKDLLRKTRPGAVVEVRSDDYFRQAGFAAFTGRLWQPLGTPMGAMGHAAVRNHADLPTLVEATAAFSEVLAAEQRSWRDADARDLQFEYDGGLRLRVDGGGRRAVEPQALDGLISRFSRAFPGNRATWRHILVHDPSQFVEIINRRMSTLDSFGYTDAGVGCRLLVRTINGQRQVSDIPSDSYMPMDPAAAILTPVMEAIGALDVEDPRVDLTYDGDTTQFRAAITYASTVDRLAREGIGSVTEAGINVTTDCTRGSPVRIEPFLRRAVCTNGMIINQGGDGFVKRHRCSRQRVHAAIAQGIEMIREGTREQVAHLATAARVFGRDIARARTVEVAPIDGVMAALIAIREQARIPAASTFADDALLTAWDATRAETGDAPRAINGADVVNVFTRTASHDPFLDGIQRWAAIQATRELVPILVGRART